MAGQLLKKLCHKHGILSAGNTHCNFIPVFDQLIFIDGFCKTSPYRLAEFFYNTSLDFPYSYIPGILFCKPGLIYLVGL